MPKPPRLRKRVSTRRDGETWLDVLTYSDTGPFDDLWGAIFGVIALVVIAVLLFSVVLPLIALTLDVLLLVVLFTFGLIGRLVFGRPWRVEATTIGTPRLTREIEARGVRGSREAIDQLADAIRSGSTLGTEPERL